MLREAATRLSQIAPQVRGDFGSELLKISAGLSNEATRVERLERAATVAPFYAGQRSPDQVRYDEIMAAGQ